MILKEPFKGKEIVESYAYMSRSGKRFPSVLRVTACNGEVFYLSWNNLNKILGMMEFDVQKKRVRKHLIPLIENKTNGQ